MVIVIELSDLKARTEAQRVVTRAQRVALTHNAHNAFRTASAAHLRLASILFEMIAMFFFRFVAREITTNPGRFVLVTGGLWVAVSGDSGTRVVADVS